MRGLAALALVLTFLTACSGEQGERAQQLLERAQAAQARVDSMAYDVRVTFTTDRGRMSLLIDGAAYTRGPRAGDQVLAMRTEGLPDGFALDMNMTMRGQSVTTTVNGRTTTATVPATVRQQYDFAGTLAELARYVKRVTVREGRVVNGERGATIAGVIDTEGLVKAASRLQALGGAAGSSPAGMDDLAERFGDTRAALFVSERTGLIRSAVVGLTVDGKDGDARVDVTYRLESVNQAIPGL